MCSLSPIKPTRSDCDRASIRGETNADRQRLPPAHAAAPRCASRASAAPQCRDAPSARQSWRCRSSSRWALCKQECAINEQKRRRQRSALAPRRPLRRRTKDLWRDTSNGRDDIQTTRSAWRPASLDPKTVAPVVERGKSEIRNQKKFTSDAPRQRSRVAQRSTRRAPSQSRWRVATPSRRAVRCRASADDDDQQTKRGNAEIASIQSTAGRRSCVSD